MSDALYSRLLLLPVLLLGLLPRGIAGPQAEELRFEAEAWTEPKDAWLINRNDGKHWNLWSTDRDAQAKWSGGVVLQSPVVKEERARPEDGAPPLHTRITGLPSGTYDVSMNSTRTLAFSRDGVNWMKTHGGILAEAEVIQNGVFELWIDDRYVNERGAPGSTYFDYLVFRPLRVLEPKPKIEGFAKAPVVEKLDRGLVAVTGAEGVLVSWRMLPGDAPDLGFNLYRQVGKEAPVQINPEPIRTTSCLLDAAAPESGELVYTLRPVEKTGEGPVQGEARRQAAEFVGIKLSGEYKFQKCGLGDLDGDGRLDYVIKQPETNIDPASSYWKKSPDTYQLEAWTHDGRFLWRYDLGWAIERGIWYSPYLVYDFDGDGRAEVAAKIGEGDPRDPDGRVTSGPEWVVILDGQTGRERCRASWPSREGFGTTASAYNFASRNQLAVAFLDGRTPCLLVLRGTYNTMKAEAWQFAGQKLEPLWTYDNTGLARKFQGQGAHFTQACDVDGDGRDEVVLGSVVLDDTGVPLWTTGLGHPDHLYIGDHNPARPGLEIYYGIETRQAKNGMCQVDARTGAILWGWDQPTTHIHATGTCSDIDPLHPGAESYSADSVNHVPTGDRWLWSAAGEVLRRDLDWSFGRNCAWWDADLQREVVQGNRLLDFGGKPAPGQFEGSIVLIADVLGDWREELVCSVPGELRIYTTAIPAMDRRTTLLADRLYRTDAAMCAQGYTQVPTLSYSLEATAPNLNLTVVDSADGSANLRLVVSAPLDRALKGTLAFTATGGTVTPGEQAVDVPPGGRLTVPATATPAPDGSGEMRLTAVLGLGDGERRVTALFSEGLADGGFERSTAGRPAGWGWFSREQTGSVASVNDVVHSGRAAAFLTYDGERDWALSNSEKLAVKPGWRLRVRGWAKSEGAGNTELAIVALAGGKTVTWSIGGAKAKGSFDWRLLEGEATVPGGVDEVYVRWVGSGPAKLHVDDAALRVVKR